jgi:cell division protein FtsL
MGSSEFLKHVADATVLVTNHAQTRTVTAEEIQALQANGCRSQDWSQIRVFKSASLTTANIVNCFFQGDVTLGSFESSVEVALLNHIFAHLHFNTRP